MCPDASGSRPGRGFAAIAAIFILVVLAVLGVTMVIFASGQQRTSAFDIQATYAFQSAKAGIEFGVYQALRSSACAASTNLTPSGTLAPYPVNVGCTSTTHTEVATVVTIYEITATACNRAACPGAVDAGYVERQLRATVATPAP
jgi:MSHA biogenesis protein MshP